jgi:hypothetical protein
MNGMREALYDLRYRWLGVRIGGADATVRGQWLVLSVSLLLVFGCFFTIGRFFHRGAAGSAAAPAAQVGAGGRPIPSALSGGSPIAGAVPVSIAVKPRAQPVAHAPAAETQLPPATVVQQSSVEGASGAVAVSEAPTASVQESQASPAPAATPSAPSKGGGSARPRPAAHEKARQSKPSTGATFDTSE